jgi:beta-glucosidase
MERQFAGKVRYALGATYTSQTPAFLPTAALTPPSGSGHGVLAEYFDNPQFQGTPKISRVEARPFFETADERGINPYSIRWTGTLRPPVSGEYAIQPRGVRLFLDDKELTAEAPTGGGRGQPPVLHVALDSGRSYKLRVEYAGTGRTGGAASVAWIPPAEPLLKEAVDAVKGADVTVAFVGLSPRLEGEEMRVTIPGFSGGDRTDLKLPESQEKLIEAAIATGKPVVVVLTTGSALAADYAAEHAAAVLEAWYGGEEIGTAIAETLAAANNPSGRLPVTFYRNVNQLPGFDNYSMDGRTYRYFKGDALYGFGFGLSYSKFTYSSLRAQRSGKGARISARVKNDSNREGDEVVQLYVGGGDSIRDLRGFQRIHLKAGETRDVSFTLEEAPPGQAPISIGGGQPVGKVARVEGTL